MATEDEARVVRRFWEEIFSRGDVDAMDEVFAANFKLHDLVYKKRRGLDDMKSIVRDTYQGIPGMRAVVEDQRLDPDGRVFTHFTIHVSPPQDAEASQQPVTPSEGWEYSGLSISRVAEGKIEESWIIWESIRATQELGSVFGSNHWRWPPWW